MVVAGWGLTQDTRHTWTVVTDGPVPETPAPPSAHKDATTRKIEYKNLVPEIEARRQHRLSPRAASLHKPCSREARPGRSGCWAGGRVYSRPFL